MYLSTATIDSVTATFIPPTFTRAAALYTFDNISLSSNGDSQLQRWSSLIGIITAIVGNILISFALNIQRYAHIRLHKEQNERKEKFKSAAKGLHNGYGATSRNGSQREESNGEHSGGEDEGEPLRSSFHSTNSRSTACSDGDHHEETYLKSPYWWGGIVLMTIGEAGNFLAYGFAPASIVSPLGVVALISNCVIAPIMLKERFRLRDFWGVMVAVAGAVTVVLSAKQQEKKLGPHEILDAVTTTAFEVYMGITMFLIGVLLWASPRYGTRTILIDLGLVGLFGGYTALSTKGVASMLSSTLWRALTTPVTYVLLAILIGTAVMQVRYVNKALQRFDSTQVIPVQFVTFTLSVIIGSAVLYRDFEKATLENVVKFVGGCLLTFFGVWLITSARAKTEGDEDEEDEEDEEEEERIVLADQDPTETQYPNASLRHQSISRKGILSQNGDSVNDGVTEDSRRSSRVSFVDPSPRPHTPRMYSNSSQQVPIRVTTSTPSELSPRSEQTPLLSNPWKNSSDDFLQVGRHPGMQSTTSSPVLPSEAQFPRDTSKPLNARSSTHGNLHTHPNHQQGPSLPNPERPSTARNSISRMMPGPLLSPLSGGLSVVIADSLRRGVESPIRSRPFRRARLGLRRSKSGSQRLADSSGGSEEVLGTSSGSNGDAPQDFSKSFEPERSTWSGLTRARSLSNTLGDLFRGKRQRTDASGDADEEAGPSGS